MQTTSKRNGRTKCQAFTLIEMMVVVVVISILIAGVFKLMSAASVNNKRAVTIARMERLQNALSGFYALYGTYPPVELYGSPDPFGQGREDDFGDELLSSLDARSAAWASKCQPVAFEYPSAKISDEYVAQVVGGSGINQTLGQTAASSTLSSDWKDIKMFKFGLLSYLLPRVEVIGIPSENKFGVNQPDKNFYKSNQWKNNNLTSRTLRPTDEDDAILKVLRAQLQIENAACARWLPNFEGIIYSGKTPDLLGIKIAKDGGGINKFRLSYWTNYNGGDEDEDHCILSKKERRPYESGALRYMTIRDGWGQEFYYHSDPPYQSYRIWSAGPNENTFPPWIPIDSLSGAQRKTVVEWTKDDIVGFDR